jgi:sphingosine kinase
VSTSALRARARTLRPARRSDLMQFPVSAPNDGLIDVVAQELVRVRGLLRAAPHRSRARTAEPRRDAPGHGRRRARRRVLDAHGAPRAVRAARAADGPRQQRYFKAHAYRLTPEHPGALVRLAVDGEAFAFDALTVEVHPGLGRVLSPHGRFAPHFTHRPARK